MSDIAQIAWVAVIVFWILMALLFTKTDSDRQRLLLTCALILALILF